MLFGGCKLVLCRQYIHYSFKMFLKFSYAILLFVLFLIVALYEDACREETQMLQVQQWIQHRVGPEEAHRGLWEDLPLYMWLPVRQQGGSALTHLQDWT